MNLEITPGQITEMFLPMRTRFASPQDQELVVTVAHAGVELRLHVPWEDLKLSLDAFESKYRRIVDTCMDVRPTNETLAGLIGK